MILLDVETPDVWTARITAVTSLVTAAGILISIILSALGRIEARKAVAENTRISTVAANTAAVAAVTAARVEAKTDEVKVAVNGPLGVALKSNAALAETVADIRGTKNDKATAVIAKIVSDDHEKNNPTEQNS